MQNSHRFPVGSVDIRLEINKGIIGNCKIYGDFFGVGEVTDIEQKLIGIRYEKESINRILDKIDVHHYFGNVTKEEILALIY